MNNSFIAVFCTDEDESSENWAVAEVFYKSQINRFLWKTNTKNAAWELGKEWAELLKLPIVLFGNDGFAQKSWPADMSEKFYQVVCSNGYQEFPCGLKTGYNQNLYISANLEDASAHLEKAKAEYDSPENLKIFEARLDEYISSGYIKEIKAG